MLTCDFEKNIGSISLHISFELKNEILGITGHSGSGKSTILECIAGFEKINAGYIKFNQKNWSNFSPQNKQLGYVMQSPTLFPHLTVKRNLEFAGSRNSTLEESFKIDALLSRYPHELSGGQKQRVNIIQNIIRKPQLLLLDEATSAQDNEMKAVIIEHLQTLSIPMIIVSHDQNVLQSLCGRTLLISSPNETDFSLHQFEFSV